MQKLSLTPVLDLRNVERSEVLEAVRGFQMKHKQKPNIAVVGYDGVSRNFGTTFNPEYGLEYLIGANSAPDDAEVTITDTSDVIKTFMELTQYTCPHGYEFQLYNSTLTDLGFVRNERGNYWQVVGDGSSKTLFVAHLDTADGGAAKVVTKVTDENGYVSTDGKTILGADDKAGMAVLLYLISQNVPGHYLLVIGEEVGRIGSSDEVKHMERGVWNRAIAFDRRGTGEIITHQMNRRTASKSFARALARQLRAKSAGVINLQPSDRGIYTDTVEFTGVISECTNIAIGYTGEHSQMEKQDLMYLKTMAEACAKVDWETLPTEQEYSNPEKYLNWSIVDEEDDDSPFITSYQEIASRSMWEMWGEVDSGNWSQEQVRIWALYNTTKAAQILFKLLDNYGPEVLDVMTEVEDGK